MEHKQEAAALSFRGVVGQPLQCRGSVTKHEEKKGEEDLDLFFLWTRGEANLHD